MLVYTDTKDGIQVDVTYDEESKTYEFFALRASDGKCFKSTVPEELEMPFATMVDIAVSCPHFK